MESRRISNCKHQIDMLKVERGGWWNNRTAISWWRPLTRNTLKKRDKNASKLDSPWIIPEHSLIDLYTLYRKNNGWCLCSLWQYENDVPLISFVSFPAGPNVLERRSRRRVRWSWRSSPTCISRFWVPYSFSPPITSRTSPLLWITASIVCVLLPITREPSLPFVVVKW